MYWTLNASVLPDSSCVRGSIMQVLYSIFGHTRILSATLLASEEDVVTVLLTKPEFRLAFAAAFSTSMIMISIQVVLRTKLIA